MSERGYHDRIDDERAAANPDARLLKDYRAYYRGRHRSTLSRDMRALLRGVLGHQLADNICKLVVNAAAARHELLRFRCEDKAVNDWLDDFFTRNHLSALQADAAVATLRDGNHAVALAWRDDDPERPGTGRVVVHRERWWDGEQGIHVAYEAGRPVYAVKEWDAGVGPDAVRRRVIWRPDRIERYVKEREGWRPFRLPGDPDSGPVPWLKRDGSPLGLPVVALPNGSDDDSPYGASELAGGVLGLQDEINDVQRDLTATARLTGYQMYWATGVSPQHDQSGNPLPLPVGPGQTLQNDNANARYGVLPAGDLTQLRAALMVKIEAVCRQTDTPLHVITGDWPSGAALLRADMPLVNKVNKLNKIEAPQWATVGHRGTEIYNTFAEAGGGLREDALITAVFAPPERLDALTMAQVAAAREAVKTRQGLLELGYTEDEAQRILEERDKAAEVAAERAQRAFNAGGAGF